MVSFLCFRASGWRRHRQGVSRTAANQAQPQLQACPGDLLLAEAVPGRRLQRGAEQALGGGYDRQRSEADRRKLRPRLLLAEDSG